MLLLVGVKQGYHPALKLHFCSNSLMIAVLAFRCTQGYEPPEVAKSCLQAGGYHPISSSDVFAGGQLLLEAVGGYQPQEQLDLQGTIAYRTEQEQGCFDPTQVPGQRKALEWLANLVDDPTKPDYADQVSYTSCDCMNHCKACIILVCWLCARWQSQTT